MFSVTKVTNCGFLRFGMKSSHSISMIFSWLNRAHQHGVDTIAKETLRRADPREDLVHDVIQRYFALDVREGSITERLDF